MEFKIKKYIKGIVYACLFLALSVILFVKFPGILNGSINGFSIPFSFVLPAFCVMVIVGMLVNLNKAGLPARIVLKIITVFGCIFMIIYATELLGGGNLKNIITVNPIAFFILYSAAVAFVAIVYSVTGSLPWAIRITIIIALFYGGISYFVREFRGEIFMLEDLFGSATAMDVVSNYRFKLSQYLAEAIITYAGVFLIASRLRLPKLGARQSRRLRGHVAVIGISLMYLSLSNSTLDRFELFPNVWEQSASIERNGSIINFIGNIQDSVVKVPERYSLKKVNKIAAGYVSDSTQDAEVKPDIVLILGESWADITPDGLINTNTEYLPFISEFKDMNNGLYRSLAASTYGGGTSNCEFQILTGASMIYGFHRMPFNENVREGMPSIVDSLKRLGYNTTAMHTGTSHAWNRNKAFPMMGFENFYSENVLREYADKKTRVYLSDEAIYNKTLDILDSSDEPQFIYGITIQTHGGYDDESYDSPITIDSASGSYPKAEQYMGLMHESDKDFKEFIEALKERERPVIVLAFGDHLPAVDSEYVDYIQGALTEKSEKAMWKYNTFFTMWSNFPLKNDAEDLSDSISMNYLGSYLMHSAGLPLTGYQKFLLDCANKYPVTAISGFVSSEGKYTSLKDAWANQVFSDQSILQYNMLYDTKNYPNDFYYLLEKPISGR